MTSYLLAGPAQEPLALAEAKAHLKVELTDEDALISTLITAARLHVEAVTGRVLVNQDWRLVCDAWPRSRTIELPRSPLVSLNAVTVYDTNDLPALVDPTRFLTEPGAVPPKVHLPANGPVIEPLRPHAAIEIDYTAGYGATAAAVPADLREALLRLIAFWFENRVAVVTAGTGALVPKGFDGLLSPYRSIRL